MHLKTLVPNAISLSRIPASIGFLLIYDSRDSSFYLTALAIALFALGTDFVDGYLARRWKVVSEVGYFLDGLSDKAFYVAIVLVMIREDFTGIGLAWLLIGRELFLYALRSIDSRRMQNIEHLKPLSRFYALILRLYFACFVLKGGLLAFGYEVPAELKYASLLAYAAVALGYISLARLVREIARET